MIRETKPIKALRNVVYALGNGKVYAATTTSSFWGNEGGEAVAYTLTDGPASGKSVYFAESCTPTVTVGQIVTSSTEICQMHGDNDPWIETGWANGSITSDAVPVAYPNYTPHVPDGTPMDCGANFSKLMGALGAPPGNINMSASTTIAGNLCAGYPAW